MMNRAKHLMYIALLAILVIGTTACSDSNSGEPDLEVLRFNFAPGFAGVHLNAPLEITFSTAIDPDSVNPDTIAIFTTTTTTEQPDPGAPAEGEYIVSGNVVRFLPNVPRKEPDLSDAGLRIGFTYTVQVPASPDVIEPVRGLDETPGDGVPTGKPNTVSYQEFFTTLNQTILPAPGDILAEANLSSLSLFFIDEGIQNGTDPCDRANLPVADQDSPQVIFTNPQEGERGFGTITGIQPGLGTAFVRLDPITLVFSEPISIWRVRAQNISIRNENLDGETFDLFLFFGQDRTESRLQVTVFDADSAFDQASVPQGRYVLSLTQFTDLAGNPLVNSAGQACVADGSFDLSFSTVASPTLPTDLTMTFGDDDQDGHIDVGGLKTGLNNPNFFPTFAPPILGGMSTNQEGGSTSPSVMTTGANWGDVGLWPGSAIRYDNGLLPPDLANPDGIDRPIPDALRLRGGSEGAATALLSPLAGYGTGASDSASGTTTGQVPSSVPGRVDFVLTGASTASLFTGDATTGPIIYHFHEFTMLPGDANTPAAAQLVRPTLTARADSMFPLMIFVEADATLTGDVILDGGDGEFGFDGATDGSSLGRNPGGLGGSAFAGGGAGGDAGSSTIGLGAVLCNGLNGEVPHNLVVGPLDQLGEAIAGLNNMSTGGGGWWDTTQDPDIDPRPAYCGGGGAGMGENGTAGGDIDPGQTGGAHGVAGKSYGNQVDFTDPDVFAAGGNGGGGGAAVDRSNDDSGPNDQSDVTDAGGGGGGGGGGFFGLFAGGDIVLGRFNDGGTPDPDDSDDDFYEAAVIRVTGGRGGSTYETVSGSPPVPGNDPNNPDITADIGLGAAGGGGGGGGMALMCNGSLEFTCAQLLAWAKRGGNAEAIEGNGRDVGDEGGSGGGGMYYFADVDGIDPAELTSPTVTLFNDPDYDIDGVEGPDLPAGDPRRLDLIEMTGAPVLSVAVYGDDQTEPGFGMSGITTEFFDTLSDAVSYDEVRVLSNAPRFPYSIDEFADRTIQVKVDTTGTGIAGLPDLSTENPTSGDLQGPQGATIEIGLHFNMDTGLAETEPQYDSRMLVPVGSPTRGKRFVRVRIMFDLSLIGSQSELLESFAPPGLPDEIIADNPATPELDNTLGNTDTAPAGVPAIADLRVRFTP